MATRREVNLGILSTAAAAATTLSATKSLAQTPQAIALPAPAMEGGMSLMQSLKSRQSIRDYADRALSDQDLSNLLWAAWGVNRPHDDGRTVPRWRDAYLLDIYVIRADGVWLYEPKTHRLLFHMAGDLRGQTTTGQPFVAKAPVNLAYAVDTSKITGESESDKYATAGATAGVTGQSVYLYCASAGLATVFRESVPAALAKTLKLPAGQIIQFAQTVGYPKA
jgi:Nitroreductase family